MSSVALPQPLISCGSLLVVPRDIWSGRMPSLSSFAKIIDRRVAFSYAPGIGTTVMKRFRKRSPPSSAFGDSSL